MPLRRTPLPGTLPLSKSAESDEAVTKGGGFSHTARERLRVLGFHLDYH